MAINAYDSRERDQIASAQPANEGARSQAMRGRRRAMPSVFIPIHPIPVNAAASIMKRRRGLVRKTRMLRRKRPGFTILK
jgi:hypothetical protein